MAPESGHQAEKFGKMAEALVHAGPGAGTNLRPRIPAGRRNATQPSVLREPASSALTQGPGRTLPGTLGKEGPLLSPVWCGGHSTPPPTAPTAVREGRARRVTRLSYKLGTPNQKIRKQKGRERNALFTLGVTSISFVCCVFSPLGILSFYFLAFSLSKPRSHQRKAVTPVGHVHQESHRSGRAHKSEREYGSLETEACPGGCGSPG